MRGRTGPLWRKSRKGDKWGVARSPWNGVGRDSGPGSEVRDARSPGRRRPRGRRAPAVVTAGGRGVGDALRALGLCYLVLEPHLRGGGVRRAAVEARRARRAEDQGRVTSCRVPRCSLVRPLRNPCRRL